MNFTRGMKRFVAEQFLNFQTRDGLRSQLLRQGAGTFALRSVHLLLMLGLTITMARILGPQWYGTYTFFFAVASLLSIPTQVGLPPLVIRETAKYQVREDWSRMRGIWIWSVGVVCLLTGFLMFVLLTVLFFLSGHYSDLHVHTLFWAILLIPFLSLSSLRGAALQGLRHTVKGQLPERIIQPTILIAIALAARLILGPGKVSPQDAMLMHLTAAVCAFVVGAFLLARYRPNPELKFLKPIFEHKAWLRSMLPIAFISGLLVIHQNTDVLMLGLLNDAAGVGVYKVAGQIGSVVAFGLIILSTITAPYLSRFHAQNDHVRLQRILTISAQSALTVALLLVSALVVFGEWILSAFFGNDYARGYAPMLILSISQLTTAAFGTVGLLLNMTGHERDTFRGVAIGTLMNLFLNTIFIPLYGLEGAAIATSLSLFICNFILWRLAKRRLSLDTSAFKRNRSS